MTRRAEWYFGFAAVGVITYLVWGTGAFSDDFDAMAQLRGVSLADVLLFRTPSYFVETPIQHFTHYVPYLWFRLDDVVAPSALKIGYTTIACVCLRCFWGLYVNPGRAWAASLLFLFYPTHDATVYWFQGYHLTLTIACYLFAFYAARRRRYAVAVITATIASFVSYGSPPVAVALLVLCILHRDTRSAFALMAPNLAYVVYYLMVTASTTPVARLPSAIDPVAFGRHALVQVLTFADTMIGPSLWLKLVFAPRELDVTAAVIAVLVGAGAIGLTMRAAPSPGYDRRLLCALAALCAGALAMFGLTGHYPQVAFNLGDRVTIYGSLLAVYVIVALPAPRVVTAVVVGGLIVVAIGISAHWKQWTRHQAQVIATIRSNDSVSSLSPGTVVLVSGNQYSRYGPLSHVEFLSEDWVTRPVFRLALGKDIRAIALNRRHSSADGLLIDHKYGHEVALPEFITVYDSDAGMVRRLPVDQLSDYIARLPAEHRHWIQLIRVPALARVFVRLMPRLEYVLDPPKSG